EPALLQQGLQQGPDLVAQFVRKVVVGGRRACPEVAGETPDDGLLRRADAQVHEPSVGGAGASRPRARHPSSRRNSPSWNDLAPPTVHLCDRSKAKRGSD